MTHCAPFDRPLLGTTLLEDGYEVWLSSNGGVGSQVCHGDSGGPLLQIARVT